MFIFRFIGWIIFGYLFAIIFKGILQLFSIQRKVKSFHHEPKADYKINIDENNIENADFEEIIDEKDNE